MIKMNSSMHIQICLLVNYFFIIISIREATFIGLVDLNIKNYIYIFVGYDKNPYNLVRPF